MITRILCVHDDYTIPLKNINDNDNLIPFKIFF